MFCYNLHPVQPEEDSPHLRAWFLSRFLPRCWRFYVVFPSPRSSTPEREGERERDREERRERERRGERENREEQGCGTDGCVIGVKVE